jgi:DNA-binding response OmpR family regulator
MVHLPLGADHLAPGDVEASTAPAATAAESTPLPPHVRSSGAEEPAPLDPPEDAPTIFIVDDDKPVRDYVRDVLGGTYHVMEAADGEEAWALLHEHSPALVISDVMMPRLDGFGLCRRVRNDERLATMPVVFLTARAEEEARVEGWKTGADAYLTKPFSGEELSAVAENLIEVRQLLRTRVKVPDWMETNAPDVPSPDAEFLDRVQQAVGKHIDNTNFGVEWLADEVGLSARQLQRRLKKLTRLTAASFIKTMRLEHAAQLLTESSLQVQEVAHAVGYEDANYFSRLFRQAYGVPPSEYVKEAT